MPSPNISLVKSKGTKIETILSKELWKRGYRFSKTITVFIASSNRL